MPDLRPKIWTEAMSCVVCVGQAQRTHSDSITSAAPQRPAVIPAAGAGLEAGRAAKQPRNTQVRKQAEFHTKQGLSFTKGLQVLVIRYMQ